MAAGILLGEILATPISTFLRTWSPWVPSLSGIVFQLGGLLGAALVSETRPEPTSSFEEADESESLLDDSDGTELDDNEPAYHKFGVSAGERYGHRVLDSCPNYAHERLGLQHGFCRAYIPTGQHREAGVSIDHPIRLVALLMEYCASQLPHYLEGDHQPHHPTPCSPTAVYMAE